MYLLYSLLFGGYVAAMAPFLLYKTWRRQKYLVPGFRQRLGFLPESLRWDGRPTIWFHSCSVGETLSVQPLVHSLRERFPEARFVFSTVTQTGQVIARERFSKYGEGNTFYLPFDLASVTRRVIDFIRPTLIVIVETEIWPNLVHCARRRSIPVVLANGRISAASFRFYRWFRPLLRQVFRNYEVLMMKSPEDAERIEAMGAMPEKVLISGNIKYDRDLVEKDLTDAQAASLRKALSLDGNAHPLIVAGSTHSPEEKTLLETLRLLRKIPGLEKTRLLLAPRHPARFADVASLAVRAGFSLKRRSDSQRNGDKDADVILLDSLGELATAYSFATVVFVGGTLIPHGGQSILEPALHAKPIVIGPSMENFPGIIDEFLLRGGVRQIGTCGYDREAQKEELRKAFVELLQNPGVREEIGRAAFSVLERNRGAARFTVDRIAALYQEAAD